jgi:hypothetical protein
LRSKLTDPPDENVQRHVSNVLPVNQSLAHSGGLVAGPLDWVSEYPPPVMVPPENVTEYLTSA